MEQLVEFASWEPEFASEFNTHAAPLIANIRVVHVEPPRTLARVPSPTLCTTFNMLILKSAMAPLCFNLARLAALGHAAFIVDGLPPLLVALAERWSRIGTIEEIRRKFHVVGKRGDSRENRAGEGKSRTAQIPNIKIGPEDERTRISLQTFSPRGREKGRRRTRI